VATFGRRTCYKAVGKQTAKEKEKGKEVEGNSSLLDTAFIGVVVAPAERVAGAAVAGPVLHRQDEGGEPQVGHDETERENVVASGAEE